MKMQCAWMPAVTGLLLVSGLNAPATWFNELFSTDPALRGWTAVGETNLFQWDATQRQVEVTWDSRRMNSYFCRPLDTVLTRTNSFCLVFDLRVTDWTPVNDPGQPFQTWPLSAGLLNLSEACATNFWRFTGQDTPDLVEFSFWPDPGGAWQWGPSLTTVLVDSVATNADWTHWVYCTAYDGLAPGDACRVVMIYTAADQTLRTTMTRNGQPFTTFPDGHPAGQFTDFRVDHVAISSYAGSMQGTNSPGFLVAHGAVSRVAVTPPPVMDMSLGMTNGWPRVRFASAPFWSYRLERSGDFTNWTVLPETLAGTGGPVGLLDTNPPPGRSFYRIQAQLP